MKNNKVLILDDDQIICKQLGKELKRNFFQIYTAFDSQAAWEILNREEINILFLDIKLPDDNGLKILHKVRQEKPACQVIIITGYGSQEAAIESLRKGAIDYIEKPIKKEVLAAALGRAQEKSAQGKTIYTLLVVDDGEEVVKQLKKLLEQEGYEVFSAYDSKGALEIITNNKIDVVITDIKLNQEDGIELLKQAKKLYQDIEGIMITGYQEQELAVRALRAGAIDYILKPINLEELLFSIKKATERIALNRSRMYRDRELKISSEIISRMNEELERRITERTKKLKQVQSQLFQTSKLATLGEMSAGLAHEMNQPLGGISLVAKNFRKLMQRGELVRGELESGLFDIETSVQRMAKVIQHIRTFARQDTFKFVSVNVNDTLDSALSLLSEQLRLHEIKVDRKLKKELPRVIGEPYQLEQVWINLITNARDALDKKQGQLPKHQKRMTISTNYRPKLKMVEVCVSDNGAGMSEEVKKRAMEPFFTTKEVGQATGLGLSISYGIIESHRGRLELKSKENEGTTAKVLLPIEEANNHEK